MRAFAMTGIVTASWIPSIMLGSLIRATPPSLRMSLGTRSSAITATAPASSATRAWSGVTTSMITPPLSIWARPFLVAQVDVSTVTMGVLAAGLAGGLRHGGAPAWCDPAYRTAHVRFPAGAMVPVGRMGREYRYTPRKEAGRVPFMQVRTRPPREALDLEKDLERAVERNEFGLEYQPIIDLQTGNIAAVEALLRWRHPLLGTIPPGDYLPIAEENGLIVPIGKRVLETATRQL